jgi:hypothetical protein
MRHKYSVFWGDLVASIFPRIYADYEFLIFCGSFSAWAKKNHKNGKYHVAAG